MIGRAKQICNGFVAPIERFFNHHLLSLFLSHDEKQSHRINFLDGLRGIAITFVVMFHYYTRWTQPVATENLYPYGDGWASFALFKYGYLGVKLFFMISGFVIFLTLDRSKSLKEFFIRRWSRLFPSMLICSLIIYFAAKIIPSYSFSHTWQDLVPGLIFIDPDWLSTLFGFKAEGIETACWTLYTEVKFYFLIGLIYFCFSKRYSLAMLTLFNFLLIFFTLIVMRFYPQTTTLMYQIRSIFNVVQLPWFCIGMAIYSFYRRDHDRYTFLWLLISLFYAVYYSQGFKMASIVTILIFFMPFLSFKIRTLFSLPLIVLIGVVSYPLYLLHQSLGVSLIKISGDYIPQSITIIFPLLLFMFFTALSFVIYRFIEKPSLVYLRQKFYAHEKLKG